jgi:hypothetical protein
MAVIDYRSIVDAYIELWNLPDPVRGAKMAELFTDDLVYVDPIISVQGKDSLDAYIRLTRRRFGELPVSCFGTVDGHHRQLRFGWRCGEPGGEPVAAGHDFALLSDGRIEAVYGFFE